MLRPRPLGGTKSAADTDVVWTPRPPHADSRHLQKNSGDATAGWSSPERTGESLFSA